MKEMFSIQKFSLEIVIFLLMKSDFLNSSPSLVGVGRRDALFWIHPIEQPFHNLRTTCAILIKCCPNKENLLENFKLESSLWRYLWACAKGPFPGQTKIYYEKQGSYLGI